MSRLVIFIILIAFALPSTAGKLFKWVDEEGKVHYGDSVPAKYRDKERQELNQQGIQVKVYKSAEERRLEAEQAKLDLVRKKAEAERNRKDRFLLTYQSVQQIERNHQKRINAVDGDIRFINLKIKGYLKKVADIHKRAANLEIEGQIPKGLQAQIDGYKQKIAIAKNEIVKKNVLRKEIETERDRDVSRYKELKNINQKDIAGTETP